MNEPLRQGPFAESASPDRALIRATVMELAAERELDDISVEMVIRHAGIDATSFARHFPSLRDCCLQIYLANIDEFDRVVFGAADRHACWRDRLRAAAYAAARWVRMRPIETHFDMVTMLAAGDLAQAYRDRYVGRIIALIDEGRLDLDDPDSVSQDVATAVFGSMYEYLLKQVAEGAGLEAAEDLVPELMYIAVRPYLGHAVAMQELSIPAPPKAEVYG